MPRHGWTVVQHAGYVVAGDPQMIRGLQATPINSSDQALLIQALGGRVFKRMADAESWAQSEAYPIGYFGLQPVAQGTFSVQKVGDLPLYIPPDPDDL